MRSPATSSPARRWRSAATICERGITSRRIKRFRYVVETIQTTRHVEEALHRLTEAYMALGLDLEAQTAAAVLGHNYPDSELVQGELRPAHRGRAALRERVVDQLGIPRRAARRTAGMAVRSHLMLAQLSIRDIVLIDRLELNFTKRA